MKFDEYKKLELKINNEDFNQSYKIINNVLIVLSYFGNIASIFLAYFMVFKVLSGAMTDSPIIATISSIIMLSGLELIKRSIFDKFSIGFLKAKSFTKEVIPLFLLSCFIIGISFYSSITGAKEFSSKSVAIDKDKKEIMTKYSDSLTLVYNAKVKDVETEIKLVKGKIGEKDKEQTDIEAVQPLNRQQKSRINDLKNERNILRSDVAKLESDVAKNKLELADEIKQKETTITEEADSKKNDNSSNSLLFIIISTLIEIIILAGIYFGEYYKFRSYREFRDKIEKDPNYQKWVIYDRILDVVYSNDFRVNQKLPSNKAISDMCKVNDVLVLPKDITDFLKTISSLNIIRTSGSSRYINKQRDLSFELLRKHFNII